MHSTGPWQSRGGPDLAMLAEEQRMDLPKHGSVATEIVRCLLSELVQSLLSSGPQLT